MSIETDQVKESKPYFKPGRQALYSAFRLEILATPLNITLLSSYALSTRLPNSLFNF